jgi:hypothetical protein
MLHLKGEELIQKILFQSATVPATYYLGLDDRDTLSRSDELLDLINEPDTNGYTRQPIASWMIESTGAFFRSVSSLGVFTASGGSIGPVRNLFLCSSLDDSGILIASTLLSGSTTIADTESYSVRFLLSFQKC